MTDEQVHTIAQAITSTIHSEVVELIAETVTSDYVCNEVEVTIIDINRRKMTMLIALRECD